MKPDRRLFTILYKFVDIGWIVIFRGMMQTIGNQLHTLLGGNNVRKKHKSQTSQTD